MIDCYGNGNYWRDHFFFFFNSKVNAGFKHSKLLENVEPVHHFEIKKKKKNYLFKNKIFIIF
jgi:hypothetical protein